MRAEIFLAPIAEPDPKFLGNLVPFGGAERFIKSNRLLPLAPTSPIVVSLPVFASHSDPTADLFQKSGSGERGGGVLFLRGQIPSMPGRLLRDPGATPPRD